MQRLLLQYIFIKDVTLYQFSYHYFECMGLSLAVMLHYAKSIDILFYHACFYMIAETISHRILYHPFSIFLIFFLLKYS